VYKRKRKRYGGVKYDVCVFVYKGV